MSRMKVSFFLLLCAGALACEEPGVTNIEPIPCPVSEPAPAAQTPAAPTPAAPTPAAMMSGTDTAMPTAGMAMAPTPPEPAGVDPSASPSTDPTMMMVPVAEPAAPAGPGPCPAAFTCEGPPIDIVQYMGPDGVEIPLSCTNGAPIPCDACPAEFTNSVCIDVYASGAPTGTTTCGQACTP